ncbi:MAG: hypothetical protein KGJ11_00995 [Candidatus Omnitrophica bacterium]|nr:hypothetical protein [Candidatus Omnitrophota bacterium]
MKLTNVNIVPSSDNDRCIRVQGTVEYGNGDTELYWFDFPIEENRYLTCAGDPWLVCLLPVAMTLGDSLEIDFPVDGVLYENSLKLKKIWKRWYPYLHDIELHVNVQNEDLGFNEGSGRCAAFFSGGVDSLFTLIKEKQEIDDLLAVWGFDISLENDIGFRAHSEALQRINEFYRKNIIFIKTNLRKTKHCQTKWGSLSHASALASVGLFLKKKYKKLLIASSGGDNLQLWGSHVETDPLLSTSTTEVIHDGAGYSRIDKCSELLNHDYLMPYLHVCYKNSDEKNCSSCSKCLRTLVTFYLLGGLDKCRSFDLSKIDFSRISKVFMKGFSRYYFNEIRELAKQNKEKEIIKYIDNGSKLSFFIEKQLLLAKNLTRMRGVWRLGSMYENYLLNKVIH